MHNNESLILIFGRNIKQAQRALLSEQRQHYNTSLFCAVSPLFAVTGVADMSKN